MELKDIVIICISIVLFGGVLFFRRKQLMKGDIILMFLKAGAFLLIMSVLMYVK